MPLALGLSLTLIAAIFAAWFAHNKNKCSGLKAATGRVSPCIKSVSRAETEQSPWPAVFAFSLENSRVTLSGKPEWWRSAVICEIAPISFQDTNGDGKGDLKGIESRIDYLAWLGVDAVWLTPFFPLPMLDFG
jgi:pullulanase/glycogen debranching enzyme